MAQNTAIQPTHEPSIMTNDGRNHRDSWTYRPHVDIFETTEHLLLLADLPGADADRIDISLEGGLLTIQADVPPRWNDAAQCSVQEYGTGGFHRRFEVGDAIDAEAIEAEYRHGALTVRLPKAAHTRRRRIPVTS